MACVKSILIDKDGVLINSVGNSLPLLGGANNILFNTEVSFTFYDDIQQDNLTGLYIPDYNSAVKFGLSGTVVLYALPEEDSPYLVSLANATIDISQDCWIGFSGLATEIVAQCTGVTGANYINMTVFRS